MQQLDRQACNLFIRFSSMPLTSDKSHFGDYQRQCRGTSPEPYTDALSSPNDLADTSNRRHMLFIAHLIISSNLLKDLTIGPWICLPVDLDRLIPCPHILNKFFVLGITRVQLRELIALVVRRDVECRLRFLATD